MPDPVVILGLGYTTQRLAKRLSRRGVPLYVAHVRGGLPAADDLPKDAVLVHSVPPVADPERSAIRSLIRAIAPRRILYISSTGVYGAQTHVTEDTMVSPFDDKGRARVDEEEWISSESGTASSLILRSAAIYGPGRGIHMRLGEGKRPRGAGGVVSRIHVDDLAALLDAGVESEIQGAWPVADNLPSASEEVAAWCANLMGLSLPDDSPRSFPVSGRNVDGKKIIELLGVTLTHATYRTGIPACLREERVPESAISSQEPGLDDPSR